MRLSQQATDPNLHSEAYGRSGVPQCRPYLDDISPDIVVPKDGQSLPYLLRCCGVVLWQGREGACKEKAVERGN